MRQVIESKGWTLAHEYVDVGISGSKSSRPELDKLMQHAREKRFDAVLVWKLDRFGRSLRHLVNAIAELESFGIAFISLRDNLDLSTPSGRLMFGIIASMAQFERELVSERTKAGMAVAKRKGKPIGRPTGSSVNPGQVHALRSSGSTWEDVSDTLGASISNCKRVYTMAGSTSGASVDSKGLQV
jgi:DNA invertase Pin-like site-specific DNA recombinase